LLVVVMCCQPVTEKNNYSINHTPVVCLIWRQNATSILETTS